jgi:uncharacterized protein (TIGR02246 family)
MSDQGVVVSGPANAAAEEITGAVRNIVAALELAWNKGDAKAFAAVFGPQADFIDMTGGHGVGQAEIEKAYTALFNGPFAKSRVAYRIEKVKPLAPMVATVFLAQRLTLQADNGEAVIGFRPTLTLRKIGSDWKISVFQNTRIASAVRSPAAAAAEAVAPEAEPAAEAPAASADKPARKKK